MSDLEPLGPEEAVEMYLDHRRPDLSEKSLYNHKYRLNTFLEFCEEKGITNLNNLTGRDLHRYRTWRSQQVGKVTLKTNLATLRVFLEFCASIDAVEQGLREKVVLPEVKPGEESKDVKLNQERARTILDHLEKLSYASRDHVIVAILWHTGIRLGTLRSFDVQDFDRDSPCLFVRHREQAGTPLKNREAAERSIAVDEFYAQIIEDYIEHNRQPVEDSQGRDPLITSRYGRLSETAIRDTIYQLTRPCIIEDCPHDRDPETCEAMEPKHASGCPSSRSPHGIRRGAITRMLRKGVPEEVVSDRSNVSKEVMDRHYDQRSEHERMENRRKFLEENNE